MAQLNDSEIVWLVSAAKRWRNTLHGQIREDVTAHIQRVEDQLAKPVLPLELLIICPRCKQQHIDKGKFATTPHKNHSCQFCGLTFQASGQVESIGVQFFRGYKDTEHVSMRSEGEPVVSLPMLQTGEQIFHIGQKVRFKDFAGALGCDVTKVFEISAIAPMDGPEKGRVRFAEDLEYGYWVDPDLIEPVP